MLKQLSKGKEILFYYIILLTQGLLELWSEIFLWVVIYFTLTVLKVFKFGVCSGFHLPGFGMNMDIYRRKSELGHFSGSDSYRIWCLLLYLFSKYWPKFSVISLDFLSLMYKDCYSSNRKWYIDMNCWEGRHCNQSNMTSSKHFGQSLLDRKIWRYM